ncbi:MAG: ribonuclease H-like domain-containing protein [Cytophagaceae bacterium]|jgi:hypothetical protein|nr:ribonuclease H-like domain-containing protein [Cytophagaceae bacterium]
MPLPLQEIKRLLIIDIETAGIRANFSDLPDRFKPLWMKKASHISSEENPEDLYAKRAGIFAEFAKVITIGLGVLQADKQGIGLRVQAQTLEDEKELLTELASILQRETERHTRESNSHEPVFPLLVAHNGKEFDFPFLCRRYLVNGLEIPAALFMPNRKPWENNLRDTMELWKFGDWKNYTSLELLATLFDIPSSKSDLDGSQVHDAFYQDRTFHRISEYCAADVVVTAQLYLKMNNAPVIDPDRISIKIK